MAEKVDMIVEELHCPRCNAAAKLRGIGKNPDSDILAVTVCCDKCKLRKIVGFTTIRQVELSRRRAKLMYLLTMTNDPHRRLRILNTIHDIEMGEAQRELGL